MTGTEFRRLAQQRLLDAQVLLVARRYAGAYYVGGYAVECGLKACVARTFRAGIIPAKGTVDRIYTHALSNLVKYAGLDAQLVGEGQADPAFLVNWTIVKDWDESARYEKHERREAEDLLSAIADPVHGVMRWIRRFW